MKYGVDNFIRIANSYVNADTSSIDGLERRLNAWFCFKFDTTLNDPRLLEMTLEDLLILYHMHEIRANPEVIHDVIEGSDDYEEWLKKEMGESYVSKEEMIDKMIEYEKEELKNAEELPSVITTDFSKFDPE